METVDIIKQKLKQKYGQLHDRIFLDDRSQSECAVYQVDDLINSQHLVYQAILDKNISRSATLTRQRKKFIATLKDYLFVNNPISEYVDFEDEQFQGAYYIVIFETFKQMNNGRIREVILSEQTAKTLVSQSMETEQENLCCCKVQDRRLKQFLALTGPLSLVSRFSFYTEYRQSPNLLSFGHKFYKNLKEHLMITEDNGRVPYQLYQYSTKSNKIEYELKYHQPKRSDDIEYANLKQIIHGNQVQFESSTFLKDVGEGIYHIQGFKQYFRANKKSKIQYDSSDVGSENDSGDEINSRQGSNVQVQLNTKSTILWHYDRVQDNDFKHFKHRIL